MNSAVLTDLAEICGSSNVTDIQGDIAPYFSGSPPDDMALVRPADEFELSKVAKLATRNRLPMYSVKRVPMETRGDMAGGLLLDLERLKRIKRVDRRNLMGHVYAGVTFEELQAACKERDCKILLPAAAASPWVLRSYIDRDILNGSVCYRAPNLSIFHAITADGRPWISGAQQMSSEGIADFREDQGPQFSLFFGASEDIFGIPYYGIVYLYPRREERRVLAFGFDDLAAAKDLAYRVSRDEHCFECFTANARYLSVLCAQNPAKAEELRGQLPAWTTAISLEHHSELVEMWDGFVRRDAAERGGQLLGDDIAEMIDARLQTPWYLRERDYLKGRMDHVFHYDHYGRVPEMLGSVLEAVGSAGYDPAEVGQLIVPVYFGASAYLESDLYYDPGDTENATQAAAARRSAFSAVLAAGSMVDKPTGEVADMVFAKADSGWLTVLQRFKRIIDPDGLMNPGQLIEGV